MESEGFQSAESNHQIRKGHRMKSFWLFRTNLRNLEYYHHFKDIFTFVRECHDFYLLQGIWFLENDIFDEVIIWRLKPEGTKMEDIVFEVKGKKFIQRFVDDFSECFKLKRPKFSFFRGGFPEYDELTKKNPKALGHKLYLGAGKRVYPKYGGDYDKILIESEMDINPTLGTFPFYKTANPNIFKPLATGKKYDLCWICNFTQITQKGQEWFIKEVGESDKLKKLKIVHAGNNEKTGRKLCGKYGVKNIEFKGTMGRKALNELLNYSKMGIVTSNKKDGCPRVLTEIMASGIPLLVRNQTRLNGYYKHFGVLEYEKVDHGVQIAMKKYDLLQEGAQKNLEERLGIAEICEMNLSIWNQNI